jgi:cupin 2 domain-containing protein
VEFEGESQPRELKPGDYLLIPAHCRHRVAWTSSDEPSVWLAVHFGE